MIKILGHRGVRWKSAPYENTIPAFAEALTNADGLETDIVRAADGTLFLVHDVLFNGNGTRYMLADHLDDNSRKRVGDRRIDQMAAAEVSDLRLLDGQTIPRLTDFLVDCAIPGTATLNLELKSFDTAIPVLEACKTFIRPDQLILSSFNHPELLKAAGYVPAVRCGLLLEPSGTIKTPMYSWRAAPGGAFYTPYSLEYLKDPVVRDIAPWSFHIEESDLSVRTIEDIKTLFPEAKILIWWWMGNPEPPPAENKDLFVRLESLDKAGLLDSLHAIITDFPREMKEAVP
ncbi:MAG: hypothetical protein KDJ15_03810 [Alphaproteobacteria bacterium]|nr:hypothetical protein [Alphaproteobacteria bacterium]